MYKLTDCSLSQAPGRQHDFKEVSLESRRENYQNESRKFEHSLAWRLVLFSLGITYVSLCKKQHIFVHAISKVMARGINSNKLEGSWGSGIIYPKTKIPYHYYNLLPLSLSLSLSSLLLLFVADTRRVSPLYLPLYILIPRACHAGRIRILTCAPFSRREISVCSCQHSLWRKMGIFPVVRKYSLWLTISLFTSKMYGLAGLRSTLEIFLVHNFWSY